MKAKSTKYITNCFLRFAVDLKDQILFMRKLNQNTIVRAMELDRMMDNFDTSLKMKSSESSMAALLKPVIR